MNKLNLISGLITALLLVSPFAYADADYPAYDFQPTIVYQDESVIEVVAKEVVAKEAPVAIAVAEIAETSETAADEDSSLPIGFLLLAGIMFVAYKKSSTGGATKKAAASDPTGVSRYLEKQDKNQSLSGVEKYLQERG